MRRAWQTQSDDTPLITNVPSGSFDNLDYRRKRYVITMLIRAMCVLLAGLTYKHLGVAMGFALGAVVLPWVAVIMANDRPPKRKQHKLAQVNHHQTALEGPPDEYTIDG